MINPAAPAIFRTRRAKGNGRTAGSVLSQALLAHACGARQACIEVARIDAIAQDGVDHASHLVGGAADGTLALDARAAHVVVTRREDLLRERLEQPRQIDL